MRESSRRRLGGGLIAAGLLVVLGAVLYVLEAANGPGSGPRTFAERRSYDQVKVAIHRALPPAAAVALVGGVLVWWGGRLRAPRTGADGGSAGNGS